MMDRAIADEQEMDGLGNLFAHIPTILWERRWWIVLPTLVGLIAAVAATLLIKPVYQSTALMLVQSRQLPAEVTGDWGGEVIDRRIARIRQQVTSRPDLISLIEKHGLYSDQRHSEPLSKVIEAMRKSITLTPSMVDLSAGRSDEQTIAFHLGFDYSEPVAAQAVAQDLMDRILKLDAAGNVEQATNTVQFLSEQATSLEGRIREVQDQIAQVTTSNGQILSESGVAMMSGSPGSYDVQIAALQRDNANLIIQKNAAESSDTRDPAVRAAEAGLAAARARYAETHPDVVLAKQALEKARELAASNKSKLPLSTIDQQIAFNNSQIERLNAAKARDLASLNAQLAAQSRAPLVRQEISALQNKLAGLNDQYQNVQTRLTTARAGVKAEDEQMAERLSVVEPPIVPDEPYWPNRLLIVALGLGGGLGLGLVLALGLELLLSPIRGPHAIVAITGQQPLGMIPVIVPGEADQRSRHARIFGNLSPFTRLKMGG